MQICVMNLGDIVRTKGLITEQTGTVSCHRL